RRRHTIFSRDWSSDVCYSDLEDIQTQHLPDEPASSSIPNTVAIEECLDQNIPESNAVIAEESHPAIHTADSDNDEIIETLKSKEIGRATCREEEEREKAAEYI